MQILLLHSSNQRRHGVITRRRFPSQSPIPSRSRIWELRVELAILWMWRSWIWLLSRIFKPFTLRRDASCSWRVSILGLQHLKSIDIGKLCFIVTYDRVENSVLSIKDCPSLDSIRIGGNSFRCYSSLEMESESEIDIWSLDLPSLSSFVIDDGIERIGSFCESPSFRFTGMSAPMTWWIDFPSLRTAFFGRDSFCNASHVEIASEEWDGQWWIDLPKLELLHLSTGSIQGNKKNAKQEGLFALHATELRMESWAHEMVLSHRLTSIEKNWSRQCHVVPLLWECGIEEWTQRTEMTHRYCSNWVGYLAKIHVGLCLERDNW